MPRVVQVSARDVLADDALLARLDRAASLPASVRSAIAVQLRDPALAGRELASLAARLRARTRAIGASFFVNDRLDLALASGADGVHLGRASASIADARALLGDAVLVSVACHALDDVLAAAAQGADIAVLSPIFASPGKGAPLGLAAITEARRALVASADPRARRVHLVALGGVTEARVASCLAAGAGGVASIRADLMRAPG